MIEPVRSDDALLDEMGAPQPLHSIRVWWLGQSGFLVRHQESSSVSTLLIDPYLSDSLTKKYAQTDKPHVRMTKRAIDPSRLDMIDVVTSSHNHTDHLDGETLVPLLRANPELVVVVPAANQAFAAERLGVGQERLETIDEGQTKRFKNIQMHAIPAAHEAIDRDEQGRCRYLGYIFEIAGHTIYHSGDTLLYEGQVDRLRQWNIDLALLPINGRAPERRVAGNLDGEQAATLAREIRAGCVVPCHYEMFEFNTATTDLFEQTCRQLQQPYEILKCGGSLTRKEKVHAD